MDCVLGADGGKTKTIAVVARVDGRIIGSGCSGCSDTYDNNQPERTIEQIVLATDIVLERANVNKGNEIVGKERF